MSLTDPRPSQRAHMPPVMLNSRRSLTVRPAFSTVTAPAPLMDATLNENAWGEPMCGLPSRLNRIRSIAFASVAVPTVERGSAPIRCWSTMIAVVSPSRTSTSGRARVGMNPWTNALYVSLIIRCDSAAIVSNTRELLPEPETPVNTVSRRFGISTSTSLRLFSRAPSTRIRSWLSATCGAGDCGSVLMDLHPSGGPPRSGPARADALPAVPSVLRRRRGRDNGSLSTGSGAATPSSPHGRVRAGEVASGRRPRPPAQTPDGGVVPPEPARAGHGQGEAEQAERDDQLGSVVVHVEQPTGVHEDPGAGHVQGHQHADGRHGEAEDHRDATDELEE